MFIKKAPLSLRMASILVSMVVIIYGLSVLQDVLIPLLFSAIFAILLLPMCRFFERIRIPRSLSILLSLIIALAIISVFVYLIYLEIMSFEEILPQLSDKGEVWFRKVQVFIYQEFNIGRKTQLKEGQKYLTEFVKNNGDIFTNTLSTTTSFLANLSLVPLYVFLMLLYRNFFHTFLYRAFHSIGKHRVDVVINKIKDVVSNYVVGLMMVIGIVGTLNSLSLAVLGIEKAIFFGFFAAVLVLIPYIGIAIGSLLPIIMALITKDSAWYAAGVAISFGIVQFLEGNFITPYVVGSKVSINSLVAIIALILFGNLWGIAGLVLSYPLTAIIKVIFDSVDSLKPYGFLMGDAE